MNKSEQKGFFDGLGTALVILALCLGVGGCNYLTNTKGGPLISPQITIQIGE